LLCSTILNSFLDSGGIARERKVRAGVFSPVSGR